MTPQFAPRRHRAQQRLDAFARSPHRAGIWSAVDRLRAEQGHTIARWPRWCYLPWGRASRVAGEALMRARIAPDTARLLRETGDLATLAAWRVTQGVYRYDATLYQALVSTPVTGDLPVDALRRLPEWCVYIETPGMIAPALDGPPVDVAGVYAWLDWEAREDLTILQMAIDADPIAAPLAIANLPLVGTIEASIARVQSDWRDNAETIDGVSMPTRGYAEAARRFLPPVVSLVLYLCADDPDLGGVMRPRRPQPVRTKDGWRLFPATGLTRWDIGVRIGAAIRRAQSSVESESRGATGTHASPRAHIRRAHWHSFWRGPRDPQRADARQLSVQWLPPLPINVEDVADLPATIRPVQE